MSDHPRGWAGWGVIDKGIDLLGRFWPGGGNGNEGQITRAQYPTTNRFVAQQDDQGYWDDVWGWDLNPFNEPARSNGRVDGTCSPTVQVAYSQRAHCPPGYVAVRPGGPGTAQTCMLKSVAIDCKLYKNPTKPPIKARDWNCLKKAAGVQRKLDTVFRTANKASGRRIGRISAKR